MSIYYNYAPYGGEMLFCLILMIVSIGILLKLLEKNCWKFRKEIPCENLGICTLVPVNLNLSDEIPLHFCISG